MRDAFGSTLVFVIVIAFVVLFSGYICISINQTKAYNVKNEIVEAIERYGTYKSLKFKESVANAFNKQGYRTEGVCPEGSVPCDRTGTCNSFGSSNKGAFCLAAHTGKSGLLDTTYFTVTTFYQLNIPIISHYVNLKTSGETQMILGKPDCDICNPDKYDK